MFFLTALFLQEVRGHSPLATGIELLPMGFAAIAAAVVCSSLVTKVGTRPVQIGGAAIGTVGLWLLSRAGATDAYVTALLPGFVLFGIGIIAVSVPNQIAAIAEVRHDDAGAASGVVSAAYQVGGALGLAIITTIADAHTTALAHAGEPMRAALTGGFQRGLLIAAAVSVVTVLVGLLSPRIRPDAEMMAAAAAA
jgi:predicted MFS family arabinose efflux permease